YKTYASALARAIDPSTPAKPIPQATTLYCTIDSAKVEGNENETQPGTIRQAIEKEICTSQGQEGWRCVAVSRDPRNTARIQIACHNEIKLQQVKEAAQKAAVAAARVLHDQLYPVKVDNTN